MTGQQKQISDIVKGRFIQLIKAKVEQNGKLQLWRMSDIVLKSPETFGLYAMSLIHVKQHREDFQKLLCSSHKLEVEKGRHLKLPNYERYCLHCPGEIGDEMHFLFTCRMTRELREILKQKLSLMHKDWSMETWIWALKGIEKGRLQGTKPKRESTQSYGYIHF